MTATSRAFALAGTAVLTFATVASLSGQVPQPLSALPTTVAAPNDNPTTPDKVALGKLLFWDPILSGNKDVACATCHHPKHGFADGRDLSIGVDGLGLGADRHQAPGSTTPLVKRNSQTILNAAFNGIDANGHVSPADAPMFWDVRTESLEGQSLMPIASLEEMRGADYDDTTILPAIVERLLANATYRRLFATAFEGQDPVSSVNLARAIAAYERTLVTPNSPFDRYMRGDQSAMTPGQIQGMQRFQRIGCANCHSGPMFSDFKTHVLGIPDNTKLAATDSGANNSYAFRTASLRNVTLTGPYMHNGAFSTLQDVLNFYNNPGGRGRGRGGRGNGPQGVATPAIGQETAQNPAPAPPQGQGRGGGGRGGSRNPNVRGDQLDPLLRRLGGLGRDRRDIVDFLGALTDDSFDRTIPSSVPSGLTVGGNIQ